MVFLERILVAAQPQPHVMREKEIVILTLIVLEILPVELTTAKEIIPHPVVTGRISLIAVQVYNIASLFMYCSDKINNCLFYLSYIFVMFFFSSL